MAYCLLVRDMAHWQLGPVEQALKGLLVGQQEKQVAPLCGAASLIPTWKGQTGITKTVGNGLPTSTQTLFIFH
jgi:hypothetical protein